MSEVIEEQNGIIIDINKEWCKGCTICVEFCPQDVLTMNGPLVEVVNLEACTACMLCEIRCPDFAITVTDNRKKKKHAA